MEDPVKPEAKKYDAKPAKYKYTGQVHEDDKIYDLYPDGQKLRPWKWTDAELEEFRKNNPDHQALSLFVPA